MSASGDLPSIGAPTAGEKCPDRSGETLVKCLQRFCASLLTDESLGCWSLQALYKCLPSSASSTRATSSATCGYVSVANVSVHARAR